MSSSMIAMEVQSLPLLMVVSGPGGLLDGSRLMTGARGEDNNGFVDLCTCAIVMGVFTGDLARLSL